MRRLWPLHGFMVAVVGVAAVTVLVMAVVRVMRGRLLVVAVHGGSMAPVYLDGDRLLAVRVSGAHRWRVGEDLVFARNEEQVVPPGDPPFLVKRVCAVPGDLVPSDLVPSDLVHGDVGQWHGVNDSISDRPISDNHIPDNPISASLVSDSPVTDNPASDSSIPDGWLLLEAMNGSQPARSFYSVPVIAVVGKVVCRIDRSGRSGRAARSLAVRG